MARLTVPEYILQQLWNVPEFNWTDIRRTRNELLLQSDWTQLSNNNLSEAKRAEWETYRQALRDITTQDLNNIVWPTKPE